MRWIFLGIVGVGLILILPAMLIANLVGSAATDAIGDALAYEAPASTDQSAINVCVGVVCKNVTTQTSTATTQRAQIKQAAAAPSPWAIIVVASSLIIVMVTAVLMLFEVEHATTG